MRLSLLMLMGLLGVAPIVAGRQSGADQGAQGFVPHAGGGSYASAANQERVITAVEKQYNAKVIKVAETSVGGRPALKLRLMSAQRVWSVVVDAATGQVLAGT